jgi:hypothetical protein
MRIYLFFRDNDDHPDGTAANGLNLVGAHVYGKVQLSGPTPVQGVHVVVFKGSHGTGSLPNTEYVLETFTDSEGEFSFHSIDTGNHTIVIFYPGYEWGRFVLNVAQSDQVIQLPTHTLVAL